MSAGDDSVGTPRGGQTPGEPGSPAADSWSIVERLFHRAAALPPGERARWLERQGPYDARTLERLEALLRAHDALQGSGAFHPAPHDTSAARAPDAFLAALDAERAAAMLEAAAGTPATPRTLGPGDRLGRYRIERVLARGGSGVVYAARDPELDRPVALKVLPRPPGGSDPASAGRVLDEARAASALDHPHIGTVYEVGEAEDGGRFIAMASYGGGTLRDRLAAGALPLREGLEIARQLAEGLGAAHEHGLVHRDVKPENIVFDAGGRAKIVDFGLAIGDAVARRTGDVSADPSGDGAGGSTGARADAGARLRRGTAAYMSPEQRRGDPLDARTDVWSAGVTIHEMLVGERPDASGTPRGADPRLPPPVAALLARCLAHDPDDRFASGADLARALREAARSHALRRSRRRLAAGSIGLALAGVAAGALFTRGLPRVLDAEGDASGAFPERGWVLVADFDATDDVRDVGVAAREALAVDLSQSDVANVMSRAQVAQVLARMELPPDAPLDLPLAMEVAERFGAGAVVGTTVARAGSRYVLSGRALDPATGRQLFAVRTSAGADRVLGAVERLSREVRARLGENPRSLARSLPLPEVTTSSLEALRLYAEAEQAFARNEPRAATLVRAALERDPDFAMAHRLAAAQATAVLRFDEASEHITLAYTHRDRLPERERRHVEAIYHSNVTFEPRAAVEAYELLLLRYPDDARAWHNLAVTLQSWTGEHARALEAFERAAAADSSLLSTFIQGAPTAYLLGQTRTAEAMAEHAEATGLRGFTTRWRVARAFAEGDAAAVATGCASLLRERPSPSLGADDAEICGSMDVASGRLDTGVRRLLEARTAAIAARRYRNVAQVQQALAVAELLRGDPEAAAAAIAWVPANIPADRMGEPDRYITRVNLAVQAELFGLGDVARRVADAYPPYADPGHWLAQAGEALIEAARAVHAGDAREAIDAIERGRTVGHHAIGWRVWEQLSLGIAHARTGNLDAASGHLHAASDPGFLTSPFATKDRIHLPFALALLVAVEEARGETGAAGAARARLAALGVDAPGALLAPSGLSPQDER